MLIGAALIEVPFGLVVNFLVPVGGSISHQNFFLAAPILEHIRYIPVPLLLRSYYQSLPCIVQSRYCDTHLDKSIHIIIVG